MRPFGKTQDDPKDQLKKWISNMRKEDRQLDRQIKNLEREENKIKKSLLETSKRGDTDICKIMAKEIIRARRAISRIYTSKAQINSLVLSMNHQLAMLKTTGSFSKSTEIMKSIQNLFRFPDIARSMHEMSKEMMRAGIIEEMVEEMFENLDDQADLEEEIQDEVDKVLYELTSGQLGTAPSVPSDSISDNESKSAENATSSTNCDFSDMAEKLQKLRS